MTPELLLTLIQASIGIFVLVIVIMLIYPKWRKKITETKGDTSKHQKRIGLGRWVRTYFYTHLLAN